MAERRRLERFPLATPAQVIVESGFGEGAHVSLKTKNVSSAGAYLYCTQPFLEGAQVKMEMLICLDTLGRRANGKERAKIKVRGKIIRVEDGGIAIRFESKYKITTVSNGNHEIGVI